MIPPLAFGFCGLGVIESPDCATFKQMKFPKSKKSRIRKKWAKNPKHWGYEPWSYAIQTVDPPTLVCHPTFAAKIRQLLATDRFRQAAIALGSVRNVSEFAPSNASPSGSIRI